eukprot:scaffold55159_cov58-Cyclotella_meneghiniana.AAC.7
MVRCKKCCIKHCLKEQKVCKCKDHQKGTKETTQKALDLERLADAGINRLAEYRGATKFHLEAKMLQRRGVHFQP